jgi:hypothetical protein
MVWFRFRKRVKRFRTRVGGTLRTGGPAATARDFSLKRNGYGPSQKSVRL